MTAPSNAFPLGSSILLMPTIARKMRPASENLIPAPQNGGSSRLLNLTATKLVPAKITWTISAARTSF